jgi:non-ribosomal peptide synthase protein (TIGR01720 family)
VRAAKETLRAVPGGGLGYGLLRYLHPGSPGEALRRAPEAQVVLNYRGETATGTEEPLLRRVAGAIGPAAAPDAARHHLFEIEGAVTGGCFELNIAYSAARHRAATVESLVGGVMDALRELIAAGGQLETGAVSPADFPRARVSGRDLDRLLGRQTGTDRRGA